MLNDWSCQASGPARRAAYTVSANHSVAASTNLTDRLNWRLCQIVRSARVQRQAPTGSSTPPFQDRWSAVGLSREQLSGAAARRRARWSLARSIGWAAGACIPRGFLRAQRAGSRADTTMNPDNPTDPVTITNLVRSVTGEVPPTAPNRGFRRGQRLPITARSCRCGFRSRWRKHARRKCFDRRRLRHAVVAAAAQAVCRPILTPAENALAGRCSSTAKWPAGVAHSETFWPPAGGWRTAIKRWGLPERREITTVGCSRQLEPSRVEDRARRQYRREVSDLRRSDQDGPIRPGLRDAGHRR